MTPETAVVMQTDLDKLSERVEKAAAIVAQLRSDRTRLEEERNGLAAKLQTLEQQLQGNDAAALVQELSGLRKEQADWLAERRDVASKIEALVRKLERLES
jgi:predicted  nucleic acid-binding Zn-ribbon protein